ncbi:MAG: WD40 repeat domain-containing protein [Candidatus Poribacteria bacterium]|nr:WD40 repeat domain-containing protein [Candidatus Poribacteria bacterium]
MSEKTESTPIVADKGHPMSWALPDGAISRFGQGPVMAMAVSPNGAYLAVATKIGLWWYELATMQPVVLWERERGMLGAIAISPDGRLAATGDWDGVIKVWDIQQSVCITKIVRPGVKKPHSGTAIRSLAFSPDNQYLAATGSRCEIVYTWDPRTGTPLATFHDPQRETRSLYPTLTRPVAFSPDSRLLACTAPAGTTDGPDVVLVWDVVSGACIACLTEQPSFVRSLCFSPCGHTLAIGGSKGTVHVWNVNTWEQEGVYQNYDNTSRMSVCYSQEGVLHATENTRKRNTVVVWDVEQHQKRHTFVEKGWEIEEALFSSSSHFVVAGAKEWAVWSPGDTNPRKLPHSHISFPNSVTFSQDGKKVAAGFVGYGSTLFWDIANSMQPPTFFKISDASQAVSVFTSEKIHSTAFVYDENTVKITVKIGEADENTTPMTLTLPDPEAVVTAAAHAPLRHLIACADSKGHLYVWDMRSGDVRFVFTHTLPLEGNWDDDKISRLIFSQDGKHLVSVPSSSGTMANLWNIDTGKENPEFRVNCVYTVAFSPCGHKIACGMLNQIRLWDISSCRTLLTLPHTHPSCYPRALAFSPCGKYFASGAWWHRGVETEKVPIRLWEVATGENIATFWGHPTDVQDLAFSPDGTLLASGSFDGTILLWDMKPVIGS